AENNEFAGTVGLSLLDGNMVIKVSHGALGINGPITSNGAYGLFKGDPGTLVFRGNNSYAGRTDVAGGTLQLESGSGVAVPHDLLIGTSEGTGAPGSAVVRETNFAQ